MCFTILSAIYCHGQQEKKKVYFLVDTLNSPKEHRLVEISNDYEVAYTFYCKCLPPVIMGGTYDNLIYSFINTKEAKLNVTDKKPEVTYMSWKEFVHLAIRQRYFANNYDLYYRGVTKKEIQDQ